MVVMKIEFIELQTCSQVLASTVEGALKLSHCSSVIDIEWSGH